MIASLFAKFIATKLGKSLPSWAWELIFIALLVLAGVLVHHVQVVKHDDGVRAAQKAVDDAAAKKLADKALAIKAKVDKLTANITTVLRSSHDAEVSRNHDLANAVRLRGPGLATCPGNASPPAAAVRPDQAPSSGNAPVAPVSPAGGQQLIALPFDDTVAFAESFDDLLADDRSCRAWHDQVLRVWPKKSEATP